LLEIVVLGCEDHINQQATWIKGLCATLGIPKPDDQLTVRNPWRHEQKSVHKGHCCQHMIIPNIPETCNLVEFATRLECMEGVFLRCPECEKRQQPVRQEFSHRQGFDTKQEFTGRQNSQAALEAAEHDHFPDDGEDCLGMFRNQ